jgi:uncharacterized protein YaaQ
MILLCAIVQSEDADILIARLVHQGLRVTRINSVGSFLARGNATVLIGLEEERVDEVLAAIRATCHTRISYINAVSTAEPTSPLFVVTMPLEVQVGGAIVFGFPVKRLFRLIGGTAPAVADQHHPVLTHTDGDGPVEEGGSRMNLVLAIVHSDNADQVAGGLLAAGYRLTRLSTAGGFLRRGNVTLLIGVESSKVDDVLVIIQANLLPRTEPRPPEAGMPAYGATVFVIEADRFVRM